jgi:hypothetical protein
LEIINSQSLEFVSPPRRVVVEFFNRGFSSRKHSVCKLNCPSKFVGSEMLIGWATRDVPIPSILKQFVQDDASEAVVPVTFSAGVSYSDALT